MVLYNHKQYKSWWLVRREEQRNPNKANANHKFIHPFMRRKGRKNIFDSWIFATSMPMRDGWNNTFEHRNRCTPIVITPFYNITFQLDNFSSSFCAFKRAPQLTYMLIKTIATYELFPTTLFLTIYACILEPSQRSFHWAQALRNDTTLKSSFDIGNFS